MTLTVTLISLFALLAIRVPVALATSIAGFIGLVLSADLATAMSVIGTVPMAQAATYDLLTIPMFILMAELVVVSGFADDLFDALHLVFRRVRGGLGIATVGAGAGLAAISGSSVGSAATLAGTAVPQMVRKGYSPRVATGLVAVVGTLAIMIPPSNGLIIYGLISQAPIADLLIAGIVPGIITSIVLVITLQLLLIKFPVNPIEERNDAAVQKSRWRLAATMIPLLFLFLMVTGLVFTGVSTPVEAAAVGAFGALILVIWNKRFSFRVLRDALFGTARVTAMITFIIIGAKIFGHYFTVSGVTQSIVTGVADSMMPNFVILGVILLVYLILGLIMDQTAIVVLTVPITLPIVEGLGYDPIWFGIVVTLAAEIGLVSPPFGLNVFVVAKYTKRRLKDVFIGVAPFTIAVLLVLILLAAVPAITLWLPGLMS
ncbi:TRAP transporter, DctM subunit [Brevibacterium siliguriense]|uniref:TRAP transporter, DctM subunit n=1 Tax=Brevibacterium siliguriense TaxID=1136497 RepID=A0A1H1Y747_9MICO|nr:TRAP transporter large permease [Brevibacterium siliguriense]SDT17244.1 TRAP transporter, DctM subunit [Brevibacterium siliguriense]